METKQGDVIVTGMMGGCSDWCGQGGSGHELRLKGKNPRRTFEVEEIANEKSQSLEWTWKSLVFSYVFGPVEIA